MTLQEARKVIGLNIRNLNGSMQMAVATIMDAVEEKAEIIGYLQPSEDLEEEIQSFWNKCSKFQPPFCTLEVKENGFAVIARHFANWGAENAKKETPISEDLEKAADEYERSRGIVAVSDNEDCRRSFKAGAEWQKAQILQLAKNRYENAMTFVSGNSDVDQAIQLDRLALVTIIQKMEER